MKKSKIVLIAAMLVVTMVFAAACGNKDAEGTSKGVVTDSSMNTVTIEVPNGSEFTFPIEGAEIVGGESIETGDEVTVFYTGKFDESNPAQDVTVTKIQIDNKAQEATPESTEPKKDDPAPEQAAQPSSDVQQLLGVVDKIDGDIMIVSNPGGVDFYFNVKDAKLDAEFKAGDDVVVHYTGGDLVDTDQEQTVTVTKVELAP